MFSASIRLHPSFAPLLPYSRRHARQEVRFQGSPALKHILEGFGIPHTEIGDLIANGRPVGLFYGLQDGDRIEAFPVRSAVISAGEDFPPAFLLDNHLGRLAAFLRILGFDALYRNDFQDEELASLAGEGGRTLLTRDRGLLMRKAVTRGYWVRNRQPDAQLVEVVLRFSLLPAVRPLWRCPACNTPLQPVAKVEVSAQLEPLTRRYYDEFHRCPGCGKIYWQGTHVARILQRIDDLRRLLSPFDPRAS
ncbi:MAG TPA: Mut7-C RNAse domain-containing protein [Anaerolinea sp.]|nr:Mut7-C RNAse domain-containing protein [Anaerolinea sp.]